MTPLQFFMAGVCIWITVLIVLYLRKAARREQLQEQLRGKKQIRIKTKTKGNAVKIEVDEIENISQIDSIVRRQTGLSFEEVLARAVMNEIAKAEDLVGQVFITKEKGEKNV